MPSQGGELVCCRSAQPPAARWTTPLAAGRPPLRPVACLPTRLANGERCHREGPGQVQVPPAAWPGQGPRALSHAQPRHCGRAGQVRRCRSCTGRVAQAAVFCSVRRSAHARWVEHGGSEAAAQPARRSTGADLAALLEAAEHSAPLRTATRYRSPAALAELDVEPALSGGAPDTQARAGHLGCNPLAGPLLCSASTACSGPSWTLEGCPPICAQPCWCATALLCCAWRVEDEAVQLRRRLRWMWPRWQPACSACRCTSCWS